MATPETVPLAGAILDIELAELALVPAIVAAVVAADDIAAS